MRAAFSRELVGAALTDERVVLLTGDHGYALFDDTAVRLNEPWQAVEQALAWVCGRFHLVPI